MASIFDFLNPKPKPFTFGRDPRIPEVPPAEDPSVDPALLEPSVDVIPQAGVPRRTYEAPRVAFPNPADYAAEEPPSYQPKTFKEALKQGFLSMIPGYQKGFQGEFERVGQETEKANARKILMFREANDRAYQEMQFQNEVKRLEEQQAHNIAMEQADLADRQARVLQFQTDFSAAQRAIDTAYKAAGEEIDPIQRMEMASSMAGRPFQKQPQMSEADKDRLEMKAWYLGRHPELNGKYGLADAKLAELEFAADLAERRAKDEVLLNPQGVDIAAEMFARTGTMPPLGMAQGALRAQIINRAAALYPTLDLAGNLADFRANQASLTALQRNRDAVVSWEQTALKNLDQFLGAAKKIVDTGSPLINMPIRAVSRVGLGSEELAAFDAARRVAINEIARVTSNPNLTGVLSDTARREVESFIPASATLAQVYSVSTILKQDMANRVQSLDEQIAAIKARISPSGRQPANGAGITTAPPPPDRATMDRYIQRARSELGIGASPERVAARAKELYQSEQSRR